MAARRNVMILLTIVLVLAIIEAALHLLAAAARWTEQAGPGDPLLNRPAFAGQEWVPRYLAEFEELQERFVPFIDWQYREFHGTTINTDDAGRRATFNPAFGPGETPLEILVFGGSTIWGTGSRDDGTIPSALSRQVNALGCPVRVTNYGQSAYTSMQGIVRLILLLRDGIRPDLVVIYSGVNDVYGAYQSGVPGSNQNVAEMETRLYRKRSSPLEELSRGASGILREYSMIYRAIRRGEDMLRMARNPRFRFQEVGAGLSDAGLERLSAGIVAEYWKGQELLDCLAASYGFRVVRFWQPSAYAQDWDGAAHVDIRAADTALRDLYRNTSARLPDDPARRFTNLSKMFAGREDSVFVDFVHISESGNAEVAGRMIQALRRLDGEAWCSRGASAPSRPSR